MKTEIISAPEKHGLNMPTRLLKGTLRGSGRFILALLVLKSGALNTGCNPASTEKPVSSSPIVRDLPAGYHHWPAVTCPDENRESNWPALVCVDGVPGLVIYK